MTNYVLGKYLEKRSRDFLIECGFECYSPFGQNRFSINKDIFGVFDIVAVNKDFKVFFVQVTTKSGASKRRNNIREFLPKMPLNHSCAILHKWQKKKNKWVVESEIVG